MSKETFRGADYRLIISLSLSDKTSIKIFERNLHGQITTRLCSRFVVLREGHSGYKYCTSVIHLAMSTSI